MIAGWKPSWAFIISDNYAIDVVARFNETPFVKFIKKLITDVFDSLVEAHVLQMDEYADFDFAVNAGPRTSSKLAQISVGAKADGVIGPKTLEKLNAEDTRAFLAVFALAKIGRYVSICEKRDINRKYFYGWVRRTLEGV